MVIKIRYAHHWWYLGSYIFVSLLCLCGYNVSAESEIYSEVQSVKGFRNMVLGFILNTSVLPLAQVTFY